MTATDTTLEYHFCGYRLDVRQRRLFNASGESVALTSRAFDTLLVLLEKQGETLSKSQIIELVWPNSIVEENNLNQAIYCLRKALGDSRDDNNFILTVPGRGYCFVAPVEACSQTEQTGTADTATGAFYGNITPGILYGSVAPAASPAANAGFSAKELMPRLAVFVLLLLAGAGLYLYQRDIQPAAPTADNIAQTSDEMAAEPPPADVILNSIAVLPFTNLNPDEHTELFALGLHDEMIIQLAKIKSLKVMARGSVVGLMKQQYSMAEVGHKLRVQSLMTGNIMFVEDRARISIQMVDANTGITLWADTYEANRDDLAEMISIQGDIAVHVATALEADIEQSEQDNIAALPTRSFEAYRYDMAARIAHHNQDYAQEWQLSKQAIELDPDYFGALYTFASVNTVLVAIPLPGMTSRKHFELALASAERLIALAPDRSEGYEVKAVALATSRDWLGAAAMLTKLQNMKVPAADLKAVALLHMSLGNFDRAVEMYEANLITEPLNLYGRGFLLAAHELAGNQKASRVAYKIGEELSPAWWGDTVNIFLALGRREKLEDIDELVGISDELKYLLRHENDAGLIHEQLQAYRKNTDKVPVEALYYAALASRAGDHEFAVELMRISLNDVWTGLFWAWMPVFNETRKLESFRQLLRDAGVVDYWQQEGWPEVCQPHGGSFSCDWHARPSLPLLTDLD